MLSCINQNTGDRRGRHVHHVPRGGAFQHQAVRGEARRGDTYVHVIAYQNKAATTGPNAMILPLPAAVMPAPENVVDTRSFKFFLDDIHRATEIHGWRTRFEPTPGSWR
jgi:hypothetical protein